MIAMVTVTNERYILGTEVLLFSFLKYHPNYTGDLVVIHHKLPQVMQDRLVDRFNVKLESVNSMLLQKLKKTRASTSTFKK